MGVPAWLMGRRRWWALSLCGAAVILVSSVPAYLWGTHHTLATTGDPRWPPSCMACHLHATLLADGLWPRARYLTPVSLALNSKGDRAYVCASEGDSLIVVNLDVGRVEASVPVGQHPQAVQVTRDGKRAYVSNRGGSSVSVIDLHEGRELARLGAGREPCGLVMDPEESVLYVANSGEGSVSVLDLPSGREIKRLAAGKEPYDLAVSADGRAVYVANRLATASGPRGVPASELTEIDPVRQVVRQRHSFASAHLMEGVQVSPEGDLIVCSLVRTKNLLPATAVERGWMMTHGVGMVVRDVSGGQPKYYQLALDGVNRFFADPSDVTFSPDGRTLYVSHSGSDVVSVLDTGRLRSWVGQIPEGQEGLAANRLGLAARECVRARIRTAACPKGMAASPDGRYVYVAASLADAIEVIDTARLEVVRTIPLGRPQPESLVRQGARIFHSASHSFQGQFSCRSCHPDGNVDGLAYDLEPDGIGANFVDNRTLRGLVSTSPFKWSGVSPSLYTQCGPRFAKFISRTQPLTPEELLALVSFIQRVHAPGSSGVEQATDREDRLNPGSVIFFRAQDNFGEEIRPGDRCLTCHPAPTYTDRLVHDVGTGSVGETVNRFDTPGLKGLAATGPYLHDGRASSLEEIWTVFNLEDRHGVTNDLTKEQLNDLVEFLKSL